MLFLVKGGIRERTLIAVKPDGVQRRLVGQIIQRFEMRGFQLVGLKMLQVRYKPADDSVWRTCPATFSPTSLVLPLPQVSEELLLQHYTSLCKKPFYPSLLQYMTSGPVVAMVRDPLLFVVANG